MGREIEVGRTYKGIVSKIKEYGAFVEFNGGQQGLLHISELSHEPVFLLFVRASPTVPNIFFLKFDVCQLLK